MASASDGIGTQQIPKPLIRSGTADPLAHHAVLRADWGHSEFILCLGYKGEVIKKYFLNYDEAVFNHFALEHNGDGRRVELLTGRLSDWRITFVDTA